MSQNKVKDCDGEVGTMTGGREGPAVTPSSPPATEEDRANFKKLLLQMKSLSVSSNEDASDKNSHPIRNTVLKEGGVDEVTNGDKEASPKKRKKKRPGKKTNKALSSDSPSKNVQAEVETSCADFPSKSQDGKAAGSDNVKSTEAAKVPPNSNTASVAIVAKQPHTGAVQKGSRKVDPRLFQDAQQLQGPSKEAVQDEPTTEAKQRNVAARPIIKESQNSREQQGSYKDMRGSKPVYDNAQLMNGEARMSNPFERNPMFALRAVLNLIRPLKKEPGVFVCIPCDKEFFDVDKHLDKGRESHSLNWKCEMRLLTIKQLPNLTQHHIKLLNDLVSSVVEQVKMSEQQQRDAHLAWQSLNNVAKTKFKDCSVRWFGSHVNGIALRDNNVLNMDFLVLNKEEAAPSFHRFIAALEEEESFEKIERIVATNFAHANITHKASGFVIQLSLNNNGAHSTAKLISDYMGIDPRLRPLCILLRHWGKLCGIDQGENGSWQGHAFPIMVIHFLQQRKVLPVLHDLVDNPEGNPEIYLDPRNLSGRWLNTNPDSPGKLFFDMLRFYAIEHDVEKHVVSITQLRPFLRQDTKWNAKRIAVIDPFQPKHNISRYVSANMYDYIHFCLLTTTCALGIPRSESGPLFGYICPNPDPIILQHCPSLRQEYLDVTNKIFDLVLMLDNSFDVPDLRRINAEKIPDIKANLSHFKVFKELQQALKLVPQIPKTSSPCAPSANAYSSWMIDRFQAKYLTDHFRPEAFKLVLTKEVCTDKEMPPVACTSCHKNGHLRGTCPDEIIPKMSHIPPPSKELNELLEKLCLEVLETRSSEANEMKDRIQVREDVLHWLKQFNPEIDLHLFGSSINGFGGKSSDIDMCLTFKSNATGEGLNFPELVEKIQQSLKGHKNVHHLLAITTAKVPIVKFEYGKTRIQVDISLYNMLGIMNTQLLQAYSIIDRRVRPIVYMMKYLAKTTGIGDASRGSLSSYAYSLMSLYFLQQVKPPIIPVLQELYDTNDVPKVEIVEGANVYFFRNIEKLDDVWPHRNKNNSSLGELWLQLLEFYASEEFHNSQRVVCIRKKDPLYKFDKLWTSTNICIEDPFDLNHNLGSGLSKRMNIFIVKTLQKACKHFSYLPKPDKVASLEKHFFNENALSVGKPPSDRGCHICRHIGHVQNDCPRRFQARGMARPNGRNNVGGNRGNPGRPNYGFDNRGRGGVNKRDVVRDNNVRGNRDLGRISNMPPPMGHANMLNLPKPINVQNHVIVGSMKPPGFPVAPPPGHPLQGPPLRLLPPMVQGGPPFPLPRQPMPPYMWQ